MRPPEARSSRPRRGPLSRRRGRTFASTPTSAGGKRAGSSSSPRAHRNAATSRARGAAEPGTRLRLEEEAGASTCRCRRTGETSRRGSRRCGSRYPALQRARGAGRRVDPRPGRPCRPETPTAPARWLPVLRCVRRTRPSLDQHSRCDEQRVHRGGAHRPRIIERVPSLQSSGETFAYKAPRSDATLDWPP